ncbi:hypothetical protein SAMN04490248_101283 [Salinihabitans flavidus]|uniref:Permease n=1 Tax=Salinihabitans flavidus TaxID=569882 RepID=A0A1H8LT47_9RHOB|nr:AEC family transporter [Salinihabitans flavidus]SEO08291.1 hypothetical protein SAMN04490248_101283 [Salinihabitans flavidus]
MTAILGITFPIYALIALGYVIVHKGVFEASDMRTLGRYVLNLALPALLFTAVAKRDVAEVFQPDYMLVYALGGLLTAALAWGVLTLQRTDPARRALGVMGSICPNNAFVGYPIMLLAFPDLAGMILALNFLVENILLVPLSLLLMELAAGGGGRGPLRTLGGILLGLVKMPMIIGLLAGLAASLVGLTIPGPVDRVLSMLATSAAALSLIVIGGSLVGLPLSGNRGLAAQIVALKLIAQPALVGAVLLALTAVGAVSLTPDLRVAVVLSAAMPMFGIYTVLAQRHGLAGAASLAMLGATTAAFVTLNALLYLLT